MRSKLRKPPFVVFSLPRSRSAWLAHMLGHSHEVGHDLAVRCGAIGDFTGPLASEALAGTVETGAGLAHRLLAHLLPGARFLVLHRPVAEVEASFARQGITLAPGELISREAQLETIVMSGVPCVESANLSEPNCANWTYEYLLGEEPPDGWIAKCQGVNIQIDLHARILELAAAGPRLEALAKSVLSAQAELAPGSWVN